MSEDNETDCDSDRTKIELYYKLYGYLLLYYVTTGISAFTAIFSGIALFLNIFVLVTSTRRTKIKGNFRYLLIPNCINNIFLYFHVYFVYFASPVLRFLSKNFYFEYYLHFHIIRFCCFFYKLPLALNRAYAVAQPIQYEQKFSEKRVIILFISSFLAPYVLASVLALLDMYLMHFYYMFSFLSLISELCCQTLHAIIYWKIRKQIKTDMYEKMSVTDERKIEMRQVIKANFLQSAIPFILQVPFLLQQIHMQLAKALAFIWFSSIFYDLSITNIFIDPLCVLLIIGQYKKAWKDFLPKSKVIRLCFYAFLFFLACVPFYSVLQLRFFPPGTFNDT